MCMKKKKADKKIGLGMYLAKYKVALFFYAFFVISAGVCGIFYTILLARSIESITLTEFMKAIYLLIGVLAMAVSERLLTYFANQVYLFYSGKIMEDLNLDLAKQAFKLNSLTYSNHNTGAFVQRIMYDPERIVNALAAMIDYIAEVVIAIVMVTYIMTLNIWVALVLILAILLGGIVEFRRTSVLRKNNYKLRKTGDDINSLTTEIVRSEKDIKSLDLEKGLFDVSKENYGRYRKIRYKTSITDVRYWTVRDILIKVISVLLLMLGVYLMDRGMITLATFMIVYSNTDSLIAFIRNVGRIGVNLVEIKVSSKRMFSMFDEIEFVSEKFGEKDLI